jgi:NADPH:quinone reductase-like Zn-dependent oxidoreductase
MPASHSARDAERYDLIYDIAGERSILATTRLLTREGRLVLVGGPDGRWLGPVARFLQVMVLRRFVGKSGSSHS